MGERHCSKIARMQLFHELKQQFPTLPDHVISQCIDKNKANEEQCQQNLQQDSATRRSRAFFQSLANRDDNFSITDCTRSIPVMEDTAESLPSTSTMSQSYTDDDTPQDSAFEDDTDVAQRRSTSSVNLTLKLPSTTTTTITTTPTQSDESVKIISSSNDNNNSTYSRLSTAPELGSYKSWLQINLSRGGKNVVRSAGSYAADTHMSDNQSSQPIPIPTQPGFDDSFLQYHTQRSSRLKPEEWIKEKHSLFPPSATIVYISSEPALSTRFEQFRIPDQPPEVKSLPMGISDLRATQLLAESGLYRRRALNTENSYCSSLPSRFINEPNIATNLLFRKYWSAEAEEPASEETQVEPEFEEFEPPVIFDDDNVLRPQRPVSLELDGSGRRRISEPQEFLLPSEPSTSEEQRTFNIDTSDPGNTTGSHRASISPSSGAIPRTPSRLREYSRSQSRKTPEKSTQLTRTWPSDLPVLLDTSKMKRDYEVPGPSSALQPGETSSAYLPPLELNLPESDFDMQQELPIYPEIPELIKSNIEEHNQVPEGFGDEDVEMEEELTEADQKLLLEVEEEFRDEVRLQLLDKNRLERRLNTLRIEEADLEKIVMEAGKALKELDKENPVEVQLKSEIWQLRAACDSLIAEIDQLTNGEVPLGETSPESLASLQTESGSEAQSQSQATATMTEASSSESEREPEGPQWKCKKCTFLNHPLSFECGMCEFRRDNETESEEASGISEEQRTPVESSRAEGKTPDIRIRVIHNFSPQRKFSNSRFIE